MDQSEPRSFNWPVLVGVAAAACVCLVLLLAVGAYAYYRASQSFAISTGSQQPPAFERTEQPPATVRRPPLASIPTETAQTLGSTLVPDNDPYDLACRLKGICDVPRALPAPQTPFKIGDRKQFWIMNTDTSANFQADTVLRYITPHSYFWLEKGITARDKDIADLMETFEKKIYPTDRQFFGSEWAPGVDGDPHIYVLYVTGVGQSTGGYYSTPDEYNPLVRNYSNGHELFVFNADGESLTDEYTYGTLAHEFQHMIHWNLDRNESSWMNEGFSEVASLLNGYTVGGVDFSYAENPDLSLVDWTSLSDDPGVTAAHYGQSFLFLTYFLDRFGDEATRALVQDPENSLTSVDDVLRKLNVTDKQTGRPIAADDVVMDWMAALYVANGSVADGRFTYHNYTDAPQVSATETIDACPFAPQTDSVNQYGADYIEITCRGLHTLSFSGSTASGLFPADPRSGKYVFWSNRGDESDMTLTREFDFSGVSGSLDFSYWTWYDLEKGYDYLYLEASTDGHRWEILKTPSCTTKDQSGNAYGCGYTGKSGGTLARWINQSVDLSKYAGQKVQLRFEYITDAALNGEGLLLDDLSITALPYSTDFEADDGGWTADGFARIENTLPQTFRLSLIVSSQAGTTVRYVPVSPDQTADIPLSLASGESAVLVVTGTQRFTRLPAAYTVQVK